MTAARWPTARWLLGLLAVAALVLAPRVLRGPLRHWDEAWYAQVSRETPQHDHGLTPYWNGEPWFHKPPLAFWATAVSFSLLGESEVAARLFSTLCGLATVALVFGAATRATGDPRAGVLTGLLLLAIPHWVDYTSRGQLDGPLTLFVSGMLLAWWRARQAMTAPQEYSWFLVLGLCFGLALLTKGAAALLAGVVLLAYEVLAAEAKWLLRPGLFVGLAFGVLLALPWHLYEFYTFGDLFLREYGSRHFSQFFVSITPTAEHPPAPASYYLFFLLRKQWPWGIPAVAVVLWGAIPALRTTWRAWRNVGTRAWRKQPLPLVSPVPNAVADVTTTNGHFLLFCWCWAVMMPVALSASHAKWHWYLVPLYPGLALLAGQLLTRTAHGTAAVASPATKWPAWPAEAGKLLGGALVLALATLATFLMQPAVTEYEDYLCQLGPIIRQQVPADDILLTLQQGRVRTSIYPIAAGYYAQRPIHATHSLASLDQVAQRAGNPFCLLLHESFVEELGRLGQARPAATGGRPYTVAVLAQAGPVVLVRVTPVADGDG